MSGVYVTVGSTTWLGGNELFTYMTSEKCGKAERRLAVRTDEQSGKVAKRLDAGRVKPWEVAQPLLVQIQPFPPIGNDVHALFLEQRMSCISRVQEAANWGTSCG